MQLTFKKHRDTQRANFRDGYFEITFNGLAFNLTYVQRSIVKWWLYPCGSLECAKIDAEAKAGKINRELLEAKLETV